MVTSSIQSHPIPSTSLHFTSLHIQSHLHLHYYIEISGADDVDAQSNAGNGIGSNIDVSIGPKNSYITGSLLNGSILGRLY